MTIGDINIFYQQIIEGIIVIGAVAGTLDRSKIPIIK
jgi:ABC-type xylose transport system permease subunit